MRFTWHTITLVLVATLLLAGCAAPTAAPTATPVPAPTQAPTPAPSPTPAGPKTGGELKVAVEADMTGFDPHLEQTYASLIIFEQVYEGLVRYNYKMEVEPCLAESWEIPDPKTYIFHLRKGVKFHNGRELVAEDVKYSLERIKNPDFGSPYAGWLVAIESIETPDAGTVILRLSRPDAPLLASLAWKFMAVIPKEVVEEHGGKLDGVMVGTGPFKFVEWQPKTHIKLQKNPDYWMKGRPYLDAITFVPIEDATARTTALKTGTVDFSDAIAPQDVAGFQSIKDITVASHIATGYNFLAMNNAKPPFNDKRVRQAVAWAVDRQMYVDTVLFGHGVIIDGGPIPESSWAYADLHIYTKPDLEKAKALLKEAGYPDGLKITIKTPSEYADLMGAAQTAQANLKEIGIQAEVIPLEFGVFLEEAIMKGDFEMIALGFADFNEPNDFVYPQFHTGEMYNMISYSNPEVDSLLDKAREVQDRAERAKLYAQAQKIIAEDAPYVFLGHSVLYQGYYNYVKGFQPMADGSKISFLETWLDK